MVKAVISSLYRWDRTVCLKIFNYEGKRIIDTLMYVMSRLGDGPLYAGICLLLLAVNGSAGMALLKVVLPAFGLELIVQKSIKHAVKRKRPCYSLPGIVQRIVPPDEFSFPSGHTAGAFLTATALSSFFPYLAVPSCIFAVLVGISRIYNGVHYPGDVLAGMLLGILSTHISMLIMM